MRIPRITISFDKFLGDTEKAYHFLYNDGDIWLPKSICSELSIKNRTVNIAPFKYEELTGVVPQSLDNLVIDEVAETLFANQLPDYDIVEPEGIYLRAAQINKIIRVKRLRHFFVYGQMRTGKTVIATTIALSRLAADIINKVVVIAPLRTQSVWESHLNCDFRFIATEHFSIQHTRNNINLLCDEQTLVILDESHQIKNASAIRTQYIIRQTETAGQRCILSGTPIGKHAGDLYWQFAFLDPAILNYPTYEAFVETHLLYGGREGKTVVAYTGIEEISKRISPYTVIMRRAEMGIDREKLHEVESYSISNRGRYDELQKKYQDVYDKGRGNSILGYMVKLQQAANGYEIDENDHCVGYADNGRVECLRNLLCRFAGRSIVIYFKYNEDLKDITSVGIPILSGKTKRQEFDRTIDDFNKKKIPIIGLQQQISIGFSLRACDVMIYYSRKFGSISSAQSEDRACESVDRPLLIIDIAGRDTIDEWIKSTLNKQFNIINLFKNHVKNDAKQCD